MAKTDKTTKADSRKWGKNRVIETAGNWFSAQLSKDQGEPLIGTLIGVRNADNPKKKSYLLQLTESCTAVRRNSEGVTVEAGGIVAIGATQALDGVLSTIEAGTEVRIEALEKVAIDNGRTYWRMSVQTAGDES